MGEKVVFIVRTSKTKTPCCPLLNHLNLFFGVPTFPLAFLEVSPLPRGRAVPKDEKEEYPLQKGQDKRDGGGHERQDRDGAARPEFDNSNNLNHKLRDIFHNVANQPEGPDLQLRAGVPPDLEQRRVPNVRVEDRDHTKIRPGEESRSRCDPGVTLQVLFHHLGLPQLRENQDKHQDNVDAECNRDANHAGNEKGKVVWLGVHLPDKEAAGREVEESQARSDEGGVVGLGVLLPEHKIGHDDEEKVDGVDSVGKPGHNGRRRGRWGGGGGWCGGANILGADALFILENKAIETGAGCGRDIGTRVDGTGDATILPLEILVCSIGAS